MPNDTVKGQKCPQQNAQFNSHGRSSYRPSSSNLTTFPSLQTPHKTKKKKKKSPPSPKKSPPPPTSHQDSPPSPKKSPPPTSHHDSPPLPKKFAPPPTHHDSFFPWLRAGFFMSVTWSYITAQELVGLLVSLAYIFGVNPSILGLTVLAWGNSIGDLVTNLTMVLNSGQEGAQMAFSGCYAGPIFNTLFGLGLSLIGYCWSKYPSPVTILRDPYLLQTLGFLAMGLFWALVVLPRRDMRPFSFSNGFFISFFEV